MNRQQNLPSRRNDSYLTPFTELFEQYARDFFSPSLNEENNFSPRIDVRETIKTYVVTAELPGLKEEDINISLKENHLVLEGEKKNETKEERKGYFRSEIQYGSFYRTVPFDSDVDDKNVEAMFKNGVLTVTLFKKNDGREKTVKIPIKH